MSSEATIMKMTQVAVNGQPNSLLQIDPIRYPVKIMVIGPISASTSE